MVSIRPIQFKLKINFFRKNRKILRWVYIYGNIRKYWVILNQHFSLNLSQWFVYKFVNHIIIHFMCRKWGIDQKVE